MIPRKTIENLVNTNVYLYVKNVTKEFGGLLKAISDSDVVTLADKNNNLIHIPLSEIIVVTERQ